MSIFETGIRPAVDAHLQKLADEKRDYGSYWSASSGGYCMRRNIFERLKIPYTSEDARKHRVFAVGDIFHEWMQRITKEAGLSIAQELELQDEELMIRGHIDDLVLVEEKVWAENGHKPDAYLISPEVAKTTAGKEAIKTLDKLADTMKPAPHLILYDYKSVSSRSFAYQKNRPMSHYHKMQLGTYMYMLRKLGQSTPEGVEGFGYRKLEEARILKISKDDLRQSEEQLLWTPALEKEVVSYWSTLNGYWKARKLPKCTCADFEGGFLAREKYNPWFKDGEPCSIKVYEEFIKNKEAESV